MLEKESRFDGAGISTRVDRWLRNESTLLAKGLKFITGPEGEMYRESQRKKFFDFALALPVVGVAAVPTIIILGVNTIEKPFGHPFYKQTRVKTLGKTIEITKFRTMIPDADKAPDALLRFTGNYSPEEDPRNTKFGQMLRMFEFDELPQLFEVLLGKLSLVGLRSVAPNDIPVVEANRPRTSSEWKTQIYTGKMSLFSLNSAENNVNRKHILKRHHYDMLYARKESLGLDLYILYKTTRRMMRKMRQKLGLLGGKPII